MLRFAPLALPQSAGPIPSGLTKPGLYINVPPMPANFVGREQLLTDLVDQLVRGQSVALSADGLPGVGKTNLAVALARHPRVLAHFADGVLWGPLGRQADVASIQATWAEALGTDLRDLIDPMERAQRLNNAMGQRRLLLVLDDAWAWEPVAQLVPGGPNVAALLTTRNQSIAEIRRRRADGQRAYAGTEPAHALLTTLAPEAWRSDPHAAADLADRVDGLPLALELLGGYLAAP